MGFCLNTVCYNLKNLARIQQISPAKTTSPSATQDYQESKHSSIRMFVLKGPLLYLMVAPKINTVELAI